jgi:AbrB family looped-hinge helix DNA binding protein
MSVRKSEIPTAHQGTVRAKGQITVPKEIRDAVHLADGDPVQIEAADGVILIRPQKAIPADQAWFWTAAWQEGERQASADIAAGRVRTYESAEEFLRSLETD